jgi:hypothetical protein
VNSLPNVRCVCKKYNHHSLTYVTTIQVTLTYNTFMSTQFHRSSKSYHYQSLKHGTKDIATHSYTEGNRMTLISNTQRNSQVIYHPRLLQTVKLAPSNLHWPSETQFLAVWSTLQHQTEPIVKIQMEKQVTDLCQFTMKLTSRVLVPGYQNKATKSIP